MERKKLPLLLIIMMVVTLACGLSVNGNDNGGGGDDNGGGPSDEQIVQTMVAETLQANDLHKTETQAVIDATLNAANAANQPTATLAPPTNTSVPATDAESTATPTETPTATLPPSATLPAGDPRQSLGNPDYNEKFVNGKNWFLYTGALSKAEIDNGRFLYTMFSPQFGGEWTVTVPRSKNYYIETEGEIVSDCTGRDSYGFFFRAPKDDANAGYLFGFSCNGEYSLFSWDGTELTTLQDWLPAGEILVGKNQINRLGLKVEDDLISLYANGKPLATLIDDTHDGTRYGFFVWSQSTDNFQVAFDNVLYWILP